jgi:hypothetical protein
MSQGLAGKAPLASRGPPLKRLAVAASLAALSLAASASPTAASVTIGQLAPGAATAGCNQENDWVQPTVTSGNSYVVPGAGTITSWSTNAAAGSGRMLAIKIFRKTGDPNVYTVIGHDGPYPLAGGLVNTFPASIPVKAGDLLGVNATNAGTINTACFFSVPGEPTLYFFGNLNDGQSAAFVNDPGTRPNVTAVFAPSNTVTVGTTTRNKKKGTATLHLTLPNPGELTASGNGVKASSAGAVSSKAVGTGPAQLLIKAKGKKGNTLNETGKVKLTVGVRYTPTNGSAATQSVKVKLIKR